MLEFNGDSVIGQRFVEKHGAEGPKHDPYSYSEQSITKKYRSGTFLKITVHRGLVEYIKILKNDGVLSMNSSLYFDIKNENYPEADNFLSLFGVKMKDFDTLSKEYEDRCFKCGCKHSKADPGGFGYVCVRCGNYTYFEDPYGPISQYE